ncbi:MAG: amino acid--tRNA ligase-related protein [Pseudomonadota bacterium]
MSKPRTRPELLRIRHRILRAVRAWFDERGFVEVEVPTLWHEVIPEDHIEPEPCGDRWLLTSPEVHMKRLLAEGHERIYAVGPNFRAGERGPLHHPEFRMLEWYRAGGDLDALAADVEGLFSAVATALEVDRITWRGRTADLRGGWDRRGVAEVFREHARWDPVVAWDPDRFDLDTEALVGPRLGWPRPLLLEAWPAAQAALARLDPQDLRVARRVEAWVCGLELSNGFEELTDPVEQRTRFDAVDAARAARGAPRLGQPEGFLDALAEMPEAAGMALGLDRLVMLFTGAETIDEVVAIPPD